MQEQPQHYELALIISGAITEEKHPQIIESVQNLLNEFGAQNIASAFAGRKKLAYAIKNIRHGFYFTFEFDISPARLKNLAVQFKLKTDILRYLIVKKMVKNDAQILKETKLKAGRIKAKIKKENEEAEERRPIKNFSASPAQATVKMSLEDLDKKLDEILEEKII